jgi:hypothetical protein
MQRIKVSQGIAVDKDGVVKDGNGRAITGTYTGSEVFAGVVWAGDDRAPLLTFTPTWIDASLGTYNFQLPAAQVASLDVGTYTVSIKFADGSGEVLRAVLEVGPSPGTAAPLFSYITYQQMMVFSQGQVERLQDAVSDETGFAEQRAQASLDLDAMILSRYQPVPGRSRRYVDSAGSGAGSYRAFGPGPTGDPAPSRSTIRGYLGTTKLILNADVVECVAHLALAIIYLGQPGRDNPYREAGNSERALALQAFRRALIEFDTNGDGVAELRIDQDITWLL